MAEYREYSDQFLRIVEDVFTAEGGEEFTNNPNDPGGPTKFGITLSTLKQYKNDKSLTAEDVRDLTRAEAMKIYHDEYYVKPGITNLPNDLQDIVFDNAVNVGPYRAIKELQEELGALKVDGWLGPKTEKRAFEQWAELGVRLIANYAKRRWGFYINLVIQNPLLATFLRGWSNRIMRWMNLK